MSELRRTCWICGLPEKFSLKDTAVLHGTTSDMMEIRFSWAVLGLRSSDIQNFCVGSIPQRSKIVCGNFFERKIVALGLLIANVGKLGPSERLRKGGFRGEGVSPKPPGQSESQSRVENDVEPN